MRALMITLTAALRASPAAPAQCTPDEVTAKAEQLAERISQLTERDPQRAEEINEQIRQMELKRSADQLGDECEAYDKRLKQIEEAEKQAGG